MYKRLPQYIKPKKIKPEPRVVLRKIVDILEEWKKENGYADNKKGWAIFNLKKDKKSFSITFSNFDKNIIVK